MLFSELDLRKSYTYTDYFKWDFEDRVELINGVVYNMGPAPSPSHQRYSSRINADLAHFLKGQKCEVFPAPFDVRLPGKSNSGEDSINVFQPDLCVVCDPAKIDNRGCLGAPDIVVEILSPGNTTKEMKKKYEVYEESGVREYWIVSPVYQTFLIYTLIDGHFVPSRTLTAGDMVTTPILPGFVLDLAELFL